MKVSDLVKKVGKLGGDMNDKKKRRRYGVLLRFLPWQ